MSIPLRYDIPSHYRGDSFLGIQFEFTDESDQPIDLTGCNAKMQLRKSVDSPASLSWESPDSIIIDGAAGKVILGARSSEDMTIDNYNYLYDLQITYSDNVVMTFIRGLFPFEEDITN